MVLVLNQDDAAAELVSGRATFGTGWLSARWR